MSVVTRQGHPDFLDLAWDRPLKHWDDLTDRLVQVRRGRSRHVVRMVRYDERVYALKETQYSLAQHEYRVLRHLEDERLPAVRAVGVVTGRRASDGTACFRLWNPRFALRRRLGVRLLPRIPLSRERTW